jgi:hypothetical protein
MSEISPSHSAMGVTVQSANEFNFLCALAGANLSRERSQTIANWNLSAVDWSEFIRLAEHHGVLPLATRNLIEHGQGLSAEINNSLRASYEANLRRNLWFSAELTRVARHLERRQVQTAPYKGPVLAETVYRDMGLRSYSDLDFLVAPAEFLRAKEALTELGYAPSSDQTEAVERFWLRVGYERSFDFGAGDSAAGDRGAGKNLVELQWAVLPYFYAVDLRVEDLLDRRHRTVIAGSEVSCLSPEDLVLVLCVHAAKHLWTRLIWLADVAETVRMENLDWPLVRSRARKLGIARILGVSFWLVKDVLSAELPAVAEEMVASDPRTDMLGKTFAERLERAVPYDFESTEYFRWIRKLRERRSDRWRYLWRMVWTPGVGDLEAVQLPEKLFPLYRIVRSGRLMRKLLMRAGG